MSDMVVYLYHTFKSIKLIVVLFYTFFNGFTFDQKYVYRKHSFKVTTTISIFNAIYNL